MKKRLITIWLAAMLIFSLACSAADGPDPNSLPALEGIETMNTDIPHNDSEIGVLFEDKWEDGLKLQLTENLLFCFIILILVNAMLLMTTMK